MCGKAGWCKCKKSNEFHPDNLEKNREKFRKRLRDRAKAEKLQHERLLTRPKRDQESSKKANENPTEQVTDSSTEEEDEV